MASTVPSKVKMSASAVVLNEASVSAGIIMKERKLLNNPNLTPTEDGITPQVPGPKKKKRRRTGPQYIRLPGGERVRTTRDEIFRYRLAVESGSEFQWQQHIKMASTDPSKVKMSASAVVLNEASVSAGIIMKECKLLNNPNLTPTEDGITPQVPGPKKKKKRRRTGPRYIRLPGGEKVRTTRDEILRYRLAVESGSEFQWQQHTKMASTDPSKVKMSTSAVVLNEASVSLNNQSNYSKVFPVHTQDRKMASTDPSKVKMSTSAVVLNEASVSTGIIMKERKLLNNPNLWHKIIVQNCEGLHRDYILKSILDNVHPLDFIPVYYTVEGKNASFFARNCRMAIEKLCRQNLHVANPQNKDKPLKLMIILAFSHTSELLINVQENILAVLTKRYTAATKTLNLDNFYKDPDLTEFCTLSQPKILYFVLHLSKQFAIQILRLSNNDIHILSPIESVWGVKSLTTLDLRNNMIENITELNILKSMQITELLLDGNPVCDAYDEYTYVQAIKEVCPKIEKLDGVLLGKNGFLSFRRNFLCNSDGQDLVDQFLEHYFTLYDGINRTALDGLYDKNAMFSITCQYLPGQISTSTANLGQYKCISRNLKLLSDLARSEEYLIRGGNNIVKTLCSLPPTEHDPYTFTVDLVFFTGTLAIITLTGVFRETTQSLLDTERILGFTRTFVLTGRANGEYNITNEQLHVSNATTKQQKRAFKMVRIPKPSHLLIEPAKNAKEKNEMAQALKMITNLNLEWSKKCLEDCHYDLKKALILFVDLYKVDKIPEEAFLADK